MNSPTLRLIIALLALVALIFGAQAVTIYPEQIGLLLGLLVVWLLTLLTLFTRRRPVVLRGALAWLRARPGLYWFLLLVFFALAMGWWLSREQPTFGRWLTPTEFSYLAIIAWTLVFLLGYDMDGAQVRALGTRLGQSKVSGLLVMLTTALLLFFGAEAYLRIFYITTDGYGFTAMNYHWYRNFYWGRFNSLGYRDYEPLPDDPANPVTRIAIVGDSFAMGHGISNLDDTFPQMLERELGPGYDVNVIADSGRDSDVEAAYLNAYYDNIQPRLPAVVVLSYYINDIDYLLRDTPRDPDAVFTFIDAQRYPALQAFVLNFFVPNYIYYNLLQFTSPTRQTNFVQNLVDAHLDDALWPQQTAALDHIIFWTSEHDARLIVLVWPHLAAVEATRPATQRVSQFFTEQGITVVDMTDILAGRSPAELMVNRFDAHPSVWAQRLAADALYTAIIGPE